MEDYESSNYERQTGSTVIQAFYHSNLKTEGLTVSHLFDDSQEALQLSQWDSSSLDPWRSIVDIHPLGYRASSVLCRWVCLALSRKGQLSTPIQPQVIRGGMYRFVDGHTINPVTDVPLLLQLPQISLSATHCSVMLSVVSLSKKYCLSTICVLDR